MMKYFVIAIGLIVGLAVISWVVLAPKKDSSVSRSHADQSDFTINWNNPKTENRTAFLQLSFKTDDGRIPSKMRVSKKLSEILKAPVVDYQTDYN